MTLLQLISAVSDYVAGGVTLSTTTHPTKAQVTEWLNRGQRFIATIMPSEKLHELEAFSSYAFSSSPNLTDLASDILDVISVDITYTSTGARKNAQLLKAKDFYAAQQHAFSATTSSPAACVMNEKINVAPIEAGTMYITYKKVPADLSGDSDVSDLDTRFSMALIIYAVAQFYKQSEQLDIYSKYFNEFLTILKGA